VTGSVKPMVRRIASGQVLLALDHVGPGGRRGILAIRHEHVGAAVERVDDHLAVDGPGDLDAAVEDVLGQRRHLPVARPHGGGLGQEVRRPAAVELRLDLLAAGQQLEPAAVESTLQLGEEIERSAAEDLVDRGSRRSDQLDAVGHLERLRRRRFAAGAGFGAGAGFAALGAGFGAAFAAGLRAARAWA
jgi:hypothetical protein